MRALLDRLGCVLTLWCRLADRRWLVNTNARDVTGNLQPRPPGATSAPGSSDVLDRVRAFLPSLQAANAELLSADAPASASGIHIQDMEAGSESETADIQVSSTWHPQFADRRSAGTPSLSKATCCRGLT